MRSRLAIASLIFGVAALCVFPGQAGQAQSVVISSSVSYNASTNQVTGTTQTSMDYYTSAFYQASATANLYVQGISNPISSGSDASIPGVTAVAVVTTQASALANRTYTLTGTHSLGTLYQNQSWNGLICGNYYRYNDVYQYVYYGYSNYGASTTFYAGYPGACLNSPYITFGTTTNNLQTPPANVTITNPRINGNLSGTSQNALIGADVPLTASGSPAGGTYSWSFTGSPTVVSGAANQANVVVRWTQQSTFRATVNYTKDGSTATKFVDVNNRMPVLIDFRATIASDHVARNSGCSFLTGATYTLGCWTGISDDGFVWTSTSQIPSVAYLSNPSQSGIKFVQAVSAYRKRLVNGNTQCWTNRSSESNIASGWQRDADPYNQPGHPVRYFSEGNVLAMSNLDAPGEALDLSNSYDAFYVADYFETYVFYFTGDPAQPTFQRAIGLSGSGNPYARLAWNWGGQVSFNYFSSPSLYHQDFTTTIPGPINAGGTNFIQAMSSDAHNLGYNTCAGTTPTTNPIDGSDYFVQKLYADFLGRPADQNGLNYWRFNITQCGFDMNCIGTKRVDVARAFFYSSEFVGLHPALGGTRGTHDYNFNFVWACYDGFLKRCPSCAPDVDLSGLNHWVGILDGTNPDAGDGKYNNVINAFLQSAEYRDRF
jgi:hypothetical protein